MTNKELPTIRKLPTKPHSRNTPQPVTSFTRASVGSSRTIGELFRSTREQNGMSLKDCSAVLSIPEKYIQALESSHYEETPGEVYARLWVKKYASYLGLDKAMVMDRFEKEKKIREKTRVDVPKRIRTRQPFFRRIRLRSLIVSGIICVVIAYLGLFIFQSIRPPHITFDNELTDFQTSENSIIIKGHTEAGAHITMNQQPITLDTSGNFQEELLLHEGVNTFIITARKTHGLTYTKTVRIVKTAPPDITN